jgi:hypothetical protein
MTRPSETFQAAISSIVGAVLIILGVFTDTSKFTLEVQGAIVLLLGFIAWGVTAYTAAKQRKGQLASASDGAVHS